VWRLGLNAIGAGQQANDLAVEEEEEAARGLEELHFSPAIEPASRVMGAISMSHSTMGLPRFNS